MKFLCLFLIPLLLATAIKTDSPSLVQSLDLPSGTDEQLVKNFVDHSSEIGQWLLSVSVSNRRPEKPPILNCLTCSAGVALGLGIIRQVNLPPENITNSLTNLCVSLKIVPAELCRGIIQNYAPQIIFIARERPYLKTVDLCSSLLQDENCGPVNSTLTDWDIDVDENKPALITSPVLPADQPTTKVLQLTDIHLDLNYIEGAEAECDLLICCRNPVNENNTGSSRPAGAYGDYGCDLPQLAAESLFEDASKRYENYSFIMLTGDYVHHAMWATSVQENTRHNEAVSSMIEKYFKDTPVYPVVGNHEPHPCNMYTPSYLWNLEGHDFDLSWMFDNIASLYSRHLTPEAIQTFKKAGYYTITTPQGLRLVVLNTNFCYTFNFWVFYDSVDPEGQLQWFADTMLAAEQARETVDILGHVPIGHYQCWSPWSAKFNKIVNRFEGIIKGQFYGHTHEDDFKIFFEGPASENATAPRPTSSLYIGASATTYTDLNPGYKVYHVDGAGGTVNKTWEILDHETFVYNLTEANANGRPNWYRMYRARESYGLKSLRPTDLYDFVVRMLGDEELFQKFYRHYNKDSDTMEPCIDSECRLNHLCDVVTTDMGDQSHCDQLRELATEQYFGSSKYLGV